MDKNEFRLDQLETRVKALEHRNLERDNESTLSHIEERAKRLGLEVEIHHCDYSIEMGTCRLYYMRRNGALVYHFHWYPYSRNKTDVVLAFLSGLENCPKQTEKAPEVKFLKAEAPYYHPYPCPICDSAEYERRRKEK